jgi:hypothetical protein
VTDSLIGIEGTFFACVVLLASIVRPDFRGPAHPHARPVSALRPLEKRGSTARTPLDLPWRQTGNTIYLIAGCAIYKTISDMKIYKIE